MGLSFDKALGIHQYTVGIRNKNAEVISNNVANADTPNYKARGIDFSKALKTASFNQKSLNSYLTHQNHMEFKTNNPLDAKYRIPTQPDTGDGNTVDMQFEQAEFIKNSMKYQMSLNYLDSKFSGLKKALKGR